MNVHDPTSAAKFVIVATKVDGPDAVLTQRSSAHDARLDGNVEVGRTKDGWPMLEQDGFECDKLCVPRALDRAVRSVQEEGRSDGTPSSTAGDADYSH